MKKTLFYLGLVLSASLFQTGCGGSNSSPSSPAAPAAPVTHFAFGVPASATAGTAFNFTIVVVDPNGNIVTNYTGTVHFTSSDGQATLPADSTLTNGIGTFTATLKTAGGQTLSANDSVTTSIKGTSNPVTVNPAAATHFLVSLPVTVTAGTAFSFNVTARDQFNNTATGYGGTVHFSSTDGLSVLPANSTLSNGTGTFSATLKTAGGESITATDSVSSSISGTGSATVVGGNATHFYVAIPASAGAGVAFTVSVTALDQFNNVAAGYTGTVHFTSSDSIASLPANSTLSGGFASFSATLKTAGTQTISATDTVSSSVTGTSNSTTVSAAAASHFFISVPVSVTHNVSFFATAYAEDQFNNVSTGYGGTIHVTSSDGAAILPADFALSSGIGSFSVTLKTTGNQTITVKDTVTTSIAGTSNSIQVN